MLADREPFVEPRDTRKMSDEGRRKIEAAHNRLRRMAKPSAHRLHPGRLRAWWGVLKRTVSKFQSDNLTAERGAPPYCGLALFDAHRAGGAAQAGQGGEHDRHAGDQLPLDKAG